MEFFLPFQIPVFPFNISYTDRTLFIGSCFSEEIGNKLNDLKFDVLQNPNGILYDPISISDALLSYIKNKPINEENLFELNGLWHSWQHHSCFSGINKNEVLKKINDSQSRAHSFLKEAKFLFITFGTAFNYLLKNNSQNVANCHKAPGDIFLKTLLPAEEIKDNFLSTIADLEIFNPELKLVLTVSPVKHVRDGVIENNRSKSRLIEAAHLVVDEKQNAFYFPSYELVNDVLRDYRFYKKDLVHPNETAIDFVFERFSESFFDKGTKENRKEIERILLAVNHKPFVKESAAHIKFIASQIDNIERVQKKYPCIDLVKEKKYFEEQLK
ncbi:MAG: GSCFA domain-containing protein [Ginsengibacter sp.]